VGVNHRGAGCSKRALIVALLPLCALAACAGVSASAITGTWVVTQESRTNLPATIRTAVGTLVLHDDGSFRATEVPAEMLYDSERAGAALVSGSGSWTLDSGRYQQKLHLEFQTITEGPPATLPYGTDLAVSGGLFTVTIGYSRGDPDQGKRVAFKKLKTRQP
jgi:hypothetical protein